MRRPYRLAIVALLAAGAPARAAEFIPSWDLQGVWSSNVFRSPNETIRFLPDPLDPGIAVPVVSNVPKEEDFSLRTGPNVRLRDRTGDVVYDLSYALRYEEYARLNGLGNFDHFARGTSSWKVTDRTTLSLANDFIDSESLGAILDFAAPSTLDPTITGIRARRQRIKTNTANANYRYRLGPLWDLSLSGDNQLVDYEDELASDSISFTGAAQMTRSIDRRLVVGFGGQVQRADFQGVSIEDDTGQSVETEDSGTTFYQGFGILQYRFSPTFRIEANAGPAWSVPDDTTSDTIEASSYLAVNPSSCTVGSDGAPIFSRTGNSGAGCSSPAFYRDTGGPFLVQILPDQLGAPARFVTNVPSDTEGPQGALNYFGRIRLLKDWNLWHGELGVSRSASSSSGFGTSTVVTTFDSLVRWRPSRNWEVTLRGSLTQQEAASEFRDQVVVLRSDSSLVRNVYLDPNTFGSTPVPVECPQGSTPTCRLFIADPVGVPIEVRSGDKLDNVIDVETWRVVLEAQRRFSRNLTGTVTGSWYHQTQNRTIRPSFDQEFPREDTREEFRVTVGVTWTFDPIPIPL